MSNRIKLKILGLPHEYDIYPAVISQLSDDLNIGVQFFKSNPKSNLAVEFSNNQSSVTCEGHRAEMIREIHNGQGEIIETNANEVIKTLGILEVPDIGKSEGIPVYCKENIVVSENTIKFIEVAIEPGKIAAGTEVLFEPLKIN